MHCEVCQRQPSKNLTFYCSICAKSVLYQPRLNSALCLLENERTQRQIENSLGQGRSDAESGPDRSKDRFLQLLESQNDKSAANETTQEVLGHIEALRADIEAMKAAMIKKRIEIKQRKQDMMTTRQKLDSAKSTGIAQAIQEIERVQQEWVPMREELAETRWLHCQQIGRLYNLKQGKRRGGTSTRTVYSIVNTTIPNLRDLNHADPSNLTNSLNHIANLVCVVSRHLSVRLPAEIILPSSTNPLVAIRTPASSYMVRDSFKSTTAKVRKTLDADTAILARDAASTKQHHQQRPLYLRDRRKKLSVLATENVVEYEAFVEGVTLLAWDIAWLCRTQEVDVPNTKLEDVCAMGRNLWHLLAAPRLHPSLEDENPTGETMQGKAGSLQSRKESSGRPVQALTETKPSRPNAPGRSTSIQTATTTRSDVTTPAAEMTPTTWHRHGLGYMSHGTRYGFLAGWEGQRLVQEWRLHNAVKVILGIKTMLAVERQGAEWEILEGDDWDDHGRGRGQEGVDKGDGDGDGMTRLDETGVLVQQTTLRGSRGYTVIQPR